MKSQSNLQNKSKKDVIEIHGDGEIEDVLNSMQMEEDMNVVTAFSELKVEDIDEDDMGNPTLCAEYVKDIYNYMHKLEVLLTTKTIEYNLGPMFQISQLIFFCIFSMHLNHFRNRAHFKRLLQTIGSNIKQI